MVQFLALQETRHLAEAQGSFGNRQCEFKFLSAAVSLRADSLNDQWAFKLEARLRSIAVSNGSLQRMPWETLLYGSNETPLNSYPLTLTVPEARLESAASSRRAMLKLLLSYPGATFSEMLTVVLSQLDVLKDMDRFVVIDIQFLKHYAAALAEERIRREVLASLPSAPAEIQLMKQSIDGIVRVGSTALCLALGKNWVDELQRLTSMVTSIWSGKGPTALAVTTMREFQRKTLQMCEWYITANKYTVVDDTPGEQVLAGVEAMDYLWQMCPRLKACVHYHMYIYARIYLYLVSSAHPPSPWNLTNSFSIKLLQVCGYT